MKQNQIILIAFILVKFILQFSLISSDYELHRDEFLHLDQANHLAWGYLSVPPVTSWISYIIQLLGNTVFWIKFFPALAGALTMLVVWRATEAIGGGLYACILAATCLLFSVLLRINILYQPNSTDILCWTAVYYFLIRYANEEKRKWLLLAATVFAFGFLNKYNIIFLAIGLVPALLIVPERRWFLKPALYGAIGLAVLIVFPNLLWQYQNGFPVVTHMRQLSALHLDKVSRSSFLLDQVLFFYNAFFVLIAAVIALLFYKPFRQYRFLCWSLVFTVGIFTYLKAKSYYAIGLYPIYFSFGAVYIAHSLRNKWRVWKSAMIALVVVLYLPMFQLLFPNKSPETIVDNPKPYKDLGMLRWEDGKDHHLPQDFADMLGWQELAQVVDDTYSNIKEGNTIIICDNYGQAGAINYYSQKSLRAVAFHADYLNWFDLTTPYQNLIRVKELKGSEKEMAETAPYFKEAFEAGEIANKYAREKGTKVFSFIGATININEVIAAEVAAEKQP